MKKTVAGLGAALIVAIAVNGLLPSGGQAQSDPRSVLYAGTNWDGTAWVIDPQTFAVLDKFSTVPDLEERLAEINSNPDKLAYFLGIRQLVGEGHDQFVDDLFSSHDGTVLFVSRPSLADVVGMDLQTKQVLWRVPMKGYRADHMAISPDGRNLLVSDSTGNVVHQIDVSNPRAGKKVGEFPSGDSPHENNYSADGTKIFHASIGRVYTPTDQFPLVEPTTKGARYFQVVNAANNQILERLDIGKIMAENGYPNMSSAVRPMAIAPDENVFYLQLSFLHGFVVFDLAQKKPLRVVDLPKLTTEPRENYLLDSAHHGLAINDKRVLNPDGSVALEPGQKLCVAGTMDNYAAIVSTSTFTHKLLEQPVDKPYWATNSGDGRYCFMSASGSDEVVVIDYKSETQVARIPIGDHPQRLRMGTIRGEFLPAQLRTASSKPKGPAKLQVRGRTRGGRLELRLRTSRSATGRLDVAYRAKGARTTYRVKIPKRADRGWRVSLPLAAKLRGARTGTLEIAYAGNSRVRPEKLEVLAASRSAGMRRTSASIDESGRLTLAGAISRRARGSVDVRIEYLDRVEVRTLNYRARISDGRWAMKALLPSKARSGGQLFVRYAGDARAGIGGEQISRRLAAR